MEEEEKEKESPPEEACPPPPPHLQGIGWGAVGGGRWGIGCLLLGGGGGSDAPLSGKERTGDDHPNTRGEVVPEVQVEVEDPRGQRGPKCPVRGWWWWWCCVSVVNSSWCRIGWRGSSVGSKRR